MTVLRFLKPEGRGGFNPEKARKISSSSGSEAVWGSSRSPDRLAAEIAHRETKINKPPRRLEEILNRMPKDSPRKPEMGQIRIPEKKEIPDSVIKLQEATTDLKGGDAEIWKTRLENLKGIFKSLNNELIQMDGESFNNSLKYLKKISDVLNTVNTEGDRVLEFRIRSFQMSLEDFKSLERFVAEEDTPEISSNEEIKKAA